MLTNAAIMTFIKIILGILALIIVAYVIVIKATDKSDLKYARKLREGTKGEGFSSELIYQKLYMKYIKIPLVKRYLIKFRRRLEIINIDDEYKTRLQASKVITKGLLILVPVSVFIIWLTRTNLLLMAILIFFEFIMIESIMDGMVDKIDNKVLKQQVDLFAEMRHAYHEFNMVEEAIYQVSQDDEREVSRQAEKIYEILISDDPEAELEKYYDIAPNAFLKEFAGVSYLTKEFGDRKVNGASLYLKNLNNITQEMQVEILKREALDYVFQSLSIIAALPILFIEPVKQWCLSQFSFTKPFYNGKAGLIIQFLLVIIATISYMLVRKVKDNSSTNAHVTNTENPIQEKLYKKKPIKKIVDLFIPKKGTKEYQKVTKLLRDSASPLKIEWLYVNRIMYAIIAGIISIGAFIAIHNAAIKWIYEEPTTDYNLISMSDSAEKEAMEKTKRHNYFLDMFRNEPDVTIEKIEYQMKYSHKYYIDATDEEIAGEAEEVYEKLQTIKKENLQWFEILLAGTIAILGYMAPLGILFFQYKLRQLEMEDEVMQFQTIILMLMRIERVNVEMILEWLERYANIFKGSISKCVNNYESGAWEALEQLKNDVSYMEFIRIVESLQAAVEKIPIKDAFDELETEREYYREKRKASNQRLISRKGMIGKVIGFAPMVCLFVGYLIAPLVYIGLTSMGSTFETMSTMM